MNNPNRISKRMIQTGVPEWAEYWIQKRVEDMGISQAKYIRELVLRDLAEAYDRVRQIMSAEAAKREFVQEHQENDFK